jgi:Protein of unknown function (DUF1360)
MILILVIYALAVARITRLINGDTILDRPRLWIAAREKQHREVADAIKIDPSQVKTLEYHESIARRWSTALYFVQCPWCVGMWLTLATAWIPLWYADNAVARYLGVALAASHLIGVFAFAADTEEMDYEDTTVD